MSNSACDRCGGSARANLQLADRAANLCLDCQGEAAAILNRFMFRQPLAALSNPSCSGCDCDCEVHDESFVGGSVLFV